MASTVTFAPAGNELILTGPVCACRHAPSRQTVSMRVNFCISTPRVPPKEFVLHFLLAISGGTSQKKCSRRQRARYCGQSGGFTDGWPTLLRFLRKGGNWECSCQLSGRSHWSLVASRWVKTKADPSAHHPNESKSGLVGNLGSDVHRVWRVFGRDDKLGKLATYAALPRSRRSRTWSWARKTLSAC